MVGQKEKLKDSFKTKILFRLDSNETSGLKSESLWTEAKADGSFVVLNSPFYIFGVSFRDVIAAELVDGILQFKEVLSQGGHSTYRILLKNGRKITDNEPANLWKPIRRLGATYENADDKLLAIDIPPGKDIHKIYEYFQAGKDLGIWAFEEGNYESNL